MNTIRTHATEIRRYLGDHMVKMPREWKRSAALWQEWEDGLDAIRAWRDMPSSARGEADLVRRAGSTR